jgi:hypothetical protein
MANQGSAGSKQRVRPALRIAGFASVILLVSWGPSLPTAAPFVQQHWSYPSPVQLPDDPPPNDPSSGASDPDVWSDASLSEEGVCYWITDEDMAKAERDRDRLDEGHTCHHDSSSGSGW